MARKRGGVALDCAGPPAVRRLLADPAALGALLAVVPEVIFLVVDVLRDLVPPVAEARSDVEARDVQGIPKISFKVAVVRQLARLSQGRGPGPTVFCQIAG